MADEIYQVNFEEILSKIAALQEKQQLLLDKQTKSFEFLTNSVKEFKIGLQNLDDKIEQYIHNTPHISSEQQPHSTTSPNLPQPWQLTIPDSTNSLKSMCLDIPRFSGKKSPAWISRIQRYFDFYNISDSQRLMIAYFHLDGDALNWYDLMSRNQLIPTWKEFLLALEKRFGPSENTDSFENLSIVILAGSLADSHYLLDELSDKAVGVNCNWSCDKLTKTQVEERCTETKDLIMNEGRSFFFRSNCSLSQLIGKISNSFSFVGKEPRKNEGFVIALKFQKINFAHINALRSQGWANQHFTAFRSVCRTFWDPGGKLVVHDIGRELDTDMIKSSTNEAASSFMSRNWLYMWRKEQMLSYIYLRIMTESLAMIRTRNIQRKYTRLVEHTMAEENESFSCS